MKQINLKPTALNHPAGVPAFHRVVKGILWGFFLSTIFLACKKDKPVVQPPAENFHLRLSHTVMQAGALNSEQVLKVEANSTWNLALSSPVDWLQLDKTTGNSDADVKIKVIKENNTGVKRTVTITASLANGKADNKTVVVEQEPVINPMAIIWKKMLGGSGNDLSYSVIKTSDGGNLVAGRTTSNNNGDVAVSKGAVDMWLVKLAGDGNISWKKNIGGNGDEVTASVAETPDGGFVATGYTASNNNGDVGANHGGLDFFVVKVDATGNILWKKTYGGTADDWPHAITVSSEGKIAVAGMTKSNNSGDVGAGKGSEDYWVLMLENNNGNIIWKKQLGGNGSDIAKAVVPTNDGGIIVGGTTSSNNNGDVPANKGGTDFWIVKLDKDGQTNWSSTLGGNNLEELHGLAVGANNTLVATGSTRSNNGDVSGAKGSEDFWVVNLNATNGTANWKKTLGGTGVDVARSVMMQADGTIVVAGSSHSNNSGDVGTNNGAGDYWVVGLNASGNLVWNKLLGGNDEDLAYGISPTQDGGFIITGYTHSHNSGEVGSNHGNTDVWTVKVK